MWSYEAVLGRRGMGEGDSKLLLMIGAFIGWQGAAFSLFAGAAQGLAVTLFALATGRRLAPQLASEAPGEDEEHPAEQEGAEAEPSDPPPSWVGHLKLPFGPFLALGALEYLFFGDPLVEAWLGLVGRGMQLIGR